MSIFVAGYIEKGHIEGMNTTKTVRLSKEDLVEMLTGYWVRQNPAVYAGHEADARYFVLHHMGSSRRDLLLAAQVRGLVPYSWAVSA